MNNTKIITKDFDEYIDERLDLECAIEGVHQAIGTIQALDKSGEFTSETIKYLKKASDILHKIRDENE